MKNIPLLLVLLIILFSQTVIFSQVKIDRDFAPSFAAISGSAQTLNTDTLNFTVPAGNNRLLLVFVTDEDATSIASVNFGGNALTSQEQGTDGVAVDSVWSLTLGDSVTNTTANIVVVSTGGTPNESLFIGAVALVGVDQVTPVEAIQRRLVTTTNAGSSFNVPSETGDIVFDYLDTFEVSPTAGEMQTPGMGQTPLHNADDVVLMGGGVSRGYFQSSWRPGGSPTVPMSWTTTNGSIQHIVFNVNGIGPTAASVTVQGKVQTRTGRAISRATVFMTDLNGQIRSARTNPFGYFRFKDIESGQTYIFNVQAKRYTFAPQVLNINENIKGLNILAQ